jgi:hypothetical protein
MRISGISNANITAYQGILIKVFHRGHMSLKSTAQQLVVVDPSAMPHFGQGQMSLVPIEVSEHDPHQFPSMPNDMEELSSANMEVGEPGEISIVIEDMPGAPGSPDPIEVSEEPETAVEEKDDSKIDDSKPKKETKWDWDSRGAKGFIAWVKERCDDVPKHSGNDTAGLERAVSYLDKLDSEISKAMRLDLDAELDANQIEKVRSMIDDGISRLHDRLDKVKKHKKNSKKKKTSDFDDDGVLVKEAQKITGVSGTIVTVDLLTSRIARVCINGMVSAGHDIEDMFERQSKYYDLSKQQRACVMQLLEDMGYAFRQNRGFMPEDHFDIQDNDYDWASQQIESSNVYSDGKK